MSTVDLAALENVADSVIERSLVRFALVQPGYAISNHSELSAKFEQAVSLYRAGAYREARSDFLSLAELADSDIPNAGFTARLNAAACAAASKDWSMVVELLSPSFTVGRLYGHPLWNLALAWHHLNLASDALSALEMWVSRALPSHRARGLLLIAALAVKSGDLTRARDALQRASEVDAEYVVNQLQAPARQFTVDRPPAPAVRLQRALAPAVRNRLLTLVQPKRPERLAELSLLLTIDEMETFTSAIEQIAEARFHQAKTQLTELHERHPNVQPVHFAIAACELSIGNNKKAKDILLPAIGLGARVPGSALWNLACAQIRLGDFSGARDALLRCSETEYRTKGQLWVALGVLTPAAAELTDTAVSKAASPAAETLVGLRPIADRRRNRLLQLIKPRKVLSAYKPDIAKLTIRDRQTVDQILRDARQEDPPNAYSMLVPWIARYPAIYTLKVHGAAFALFAGHLTEASTLLREAAELRPLDPASRMNLAHICLHQADYLGVADALEGGQTYAMGETSDYWLALAVARAAGDHGDPGAPAARALSLATSEFSRKTITSALTECEITPAATSQTENPAMAAARKAQGNLQRGDLAGAAECLNQACGDQFERVVEIGARAFEPQFERLPDPKWDAKLTTTFLRAVQSYEDGNAAESAEDFRRLYEASPRPRIASNLVAALLRAGERRKARSAARRLGSGRTRPPWQLVYNQALSQNPNDYRDR